MSAKLNRMPVFLLALCLIAFPQGGCTTTKQPKVTRAEIKAEKERAIISGFQTFRRRQAKLNDVAYPLLVASTDLTKKKKWSYGLLFDSLKQYKKKEKPLAEQAFPELTDELTISHIIKGSPATTSGLKVEDVLKEYNGKKIKKISQLNKALKHLRSDDHPGPGKFVVSRNGERIEVSIEPMQVARYEVNLHAEQMVNAWADGKSINFTYGIMRFTESNDELALIIGHELAHNIEGHVGKAMLKTVATGVPLAILGAAVTVLTGVNVGGATQMAMKAAGAKYSRDHEREADYVGTYIAAHAGYNIDDAADFWRRFSVEIPKDIKQAYDSSHPSSPERTVRMEKVIAEIIQKEASELPLLPERR